METKKLLKLYIESMKPNTARAYRTTSKQFEAFIKKGYADATTKDAFAFFRYLRGREGIENRSGQDKPLANSTIHSRIKVMKKLYKVLVCEGLCKQNIFDTALIKLPHPKGRQKRKTVAVPLSQIRRIFKAKPKGIAEKQALCLKAVMYGGGLRINEALNLNLSNVKHTEEGILYLELTDTKANNAAIQPLPSWTYHLIRDRVSQRNLDGAGVNEKLFVTYSKTGKLLSDHYPETTARRHCKRKFKSMGLDHCSTHSLRKTGINYLIEKGFPLPEVQEFGRHKTIISTMQYRDECRVVNKNLAVKIVLDPL